MILTFLKTFLDYTLDVLPYFLIASFAGALIKTFWNVRFMTREILSKPYSPLITATVGAVVPVCSCSMIPLARSINDLSKSYAPVLAFLITAPVLSPVTVILTFGVLGAEITFIRIASVCIFALIMTFLAFFAGPKELNPFVVKEFTSAGDSKINVFLRSFADIFFSTGRYLLLGLLVAALFKVFIPENLVKDFSDSKLSYLVISLVAVPIYVCSGEEVPIARSLLDLGMTPGQAVTFMLASTGVCIPTIMVLTTFLPKRIVILYAISWFVFGALVGLVSDRLILSDHVRKDLAS